MGIKTKTSDSHCGPGPVAPVVNLNIYKHSSPKYPIFGRYKQISKDKSPGPNQYSADISKLKTMQTYPAYTMRLKAAKKNKNRQPGPSEYDLKNFNPFTSAPSYSIRRRHSEYTNVFILPNDNC